MWEKFLGCFKKKGKVICRRIKLSEIEERVPSNQRKQFQKFVQQHAIYKAGVQKYPEKLPKIDWNYYRTNVRPGYKAWVDGFEKQYAQFNTVFDSRSELVDTTRYFAEINSETEELKQQITAFKEESNFRIEKYKQQIEELSACTPFRDMTMEEFCYAYPELAPDFLNKPTFWPHTPEEQKPGPPTAKNKHENKINPSTTPSKTSPSRDDPKSPASGESSSKEAGQQQKVTLTEGKTVLSISDTESNEGKHTATATQLKKPAPLTDEKQLKSLSCSEPTLEKEVNTTKEAILTKQAASATKTPMDENQSNPNPNTAVKNEPPSTDKGLPTKGSSDMPKNEQSAPLSEDSYDSDDPKRTSPCEILHCDVDPCEDGSMKIPCPKEVYGPGPCEVPGRQPKPPCPEGYVPWEPDLYDPEPDRTPSIGPCPDGYKPSPNRAFPCNYQICEVDKDPCNPCPDGYEPCRPPEKKPKKKKKPCPDTIPPCPDGFQPCNSKPSKNLSKAKEKPCPNNQKSKKESIDKNTKRAPSSTEKTKKEPCPGIEKQMPSKSEPKKDTSLTIKSETKKTEPKTDSSPSLKSKSGKLNYEKKTSPSNVTVAKIGDCSSDEHNAKIGTSANSAVDEDTFSCDHSSSLDDFCPCDSPNKNNLSDHCKLVKVYKSKSNSKTASCLRKKQTSMIDCKELNPKIKPCSNDQPYPIKESEFDPYKPEKESCSPSESKTKPDAISCPNIESSEKEIEFDSRKNIPTSHTSYECFSDYNNCTSQTKSNQEYKKYTPYQNLKTDETCLSFNNITMKISTVNAISTNKFPATSGGAPISEVGGNVGVKPTNVTSSKINMDNCDNQIEETRFAQDNKKKLGYKPDDDYSKHMDFESTESNQVKMKEIIDTTRRAVERTSKKFSDDESNQKDFGFVVKANTEIHSVNPNPFDSKKKIGLLSAEVSKNLQHDLKKVKDSNRKSDEYNEKNNNRKLEQSKKPIIVTTKDVDKLKDMILPHRELTQLRDTNLKSDSILHEDPTYTYTEQSNLKCHKVEDKTYITNNSCFNATNMSHEETESSDVQEITDVTPVTIIKTIVEINDDFDLQPDNIKINGMQELASEVSQLLENANQSFEKAKLIHENRLQALEDATKQASLAADRAIKEATKAVDAAKILKLRTLNNASEENSRAFKMAKKHSQLASHLAIRALELKKETKTMFDEIKKKQAENKAPEVDNHN